MIMIKIVVMIDDNCGNYDDDDNDLTVIMIAMEIMLMIINNI